MASASLSNARNRHFPWNHILRLLSRYLNFFETLGFNCANLLRKWLSINFSEHFWQYRKILQFLEKSIIVSNWQWLSSVLLKNCFCSLIYVIAVIWFMFYGIIVVWLFLMKTTATASRYVNHFSLAGWLVISFAVFMFLWAALRLIQNYSCYDPGILTNKLQSEFSWITIKSFVWEDEILTTGILWSFRGHRLLNFTLLVVGSHWSDSLIGNNWKIRSFTIEIEVEFLILAFVVMTSMYSRQLSYNIFQRIDV